MDMDRWTFAQILTRDFKCEFKDDLPNLAFLKSLALLKSYANCIACWPTIVA